MRNMWRGRTPAWSCRSRSRKHAFIAKLREAQDAKLREQWSENAVRYGETADVYRGLIRAASIIAANG